MNTFSTLLALTYLNTYLEHVIQNDTLKEEFSTVLLHEGQPVIYISRALIKIQQWLSVIERDLLAIVYGQKHLNQWLYSTI